MNDWFYRTGDAPIGPAPIGELQRLLAQRMIGPATAVWREGMPGWLPNGWGRAITGMVLGGLLTLGMLALLVLIAFPR